MQFLIIFPPTPSLFLYKLIYIVAIILFLPTDLYTKIFKSIEPKRLRLLQAESELAEAMAALREETDRVAHIESNITSIQSNFQERVKRKSNFEQQIKQMGDRLERAQLLSYSLEEGR